MRYLLVMLLCAVPAVSLACSQRTVSPDAGGVDVLAGQKENPKPAGVNEPCSLVVKDDAAEILGAQVKMFSEPPVTSGDGREQRCRYTTKTGLIDVVVHTSATSSKLTVTGPECKPLSGIGDQTCIGGRNGSASIYVVK